MHCGLWSKPPRSPVPHPGRRPTLFTTRRSAHRHRRTCTLGAITSELLHAHPELRAVALKEFVGRPFPVFFRQKAWEWSLSNSDDE